MHTIEEAKTKWCPMIRLIKFNDITCSNRSDILNGGFEETRCIADQCMWWVWEEEIYYPDAREYSEYPPKTIGRCGRVKP